MASVRQPSFAGGELARALWGRVDLPRYSLGAKRLFNFFVGRSGDAVSRAGTEYLGKAAGGSVVTVAANPAAGLPAKYEVAGSGVRLIPFRWSDVDTGQNAMLEFGEQSIRVWQGGVVVATATGAVPYHRADLFKIQYAQSGDTIFLTCGGYPPATLTRTGPNSWSWQIISFAARNPAGVPWMEIDTIGATDASHPARVWNYIVTDLWRDASRRTEYETSGAFLQTAWQYSGATYRADFSYSLGDVVSLAVTGGTHYFKSLAGGAAPGGGNLNNAPVLGGNAFWQDLGASMTVSQDPTGPFSPSTAFALGPDRPLTLKLDGIPLPTDPNWLGRRIYRGRGNAFGWIGDSSTGQFVDVGDAPDFAIQPPQGLNPFAVTDVGGGNARTENPLAVTFFEQRLVLGGTEYQRTPVRAAAVFSSATGDFYNFDSRAVQQDSEALLFFLAAREREVIRTMYGGERLFVLTDCAAWTLGGGDSDLSPTNVQAKRQVNVGAGYLPVIELADAILWVRDKNTGIRAMAWNFETQKFQGHDLSFVAQHLVQSHQLVDWALQEDPWSVIWLARDDGLLLSLGRGEDEGTFGWAQHQIYTGAFFDDALALALDSSDMAARMGKVQSVCCIPEGTEDVLYLAIEGQPPEKWDLRVYNTGDMAVMTDGNVYASQQDGNTNHPDFTQTAWWRKVENTVQPSWILRMSSRVEVADGSNVVGLDCFVRYPGTYDPSAGPLVIATGLQHLNGQSVMVLLDSGEVVGPATVNNGGISIAFTQMASAAFVGIPIVHELETLNLPQNKNKKANVAEAALEVDAPAGVIYAGPSFDELKKFTGNLDGTVASADIVRVRLSGKWAFGGRACVRWIGPSPVTIVAVTREVVDASH